MKLQSIPEQGLEATRHLERYVNNVLGSHESHSRTSVRFSPHEGDESFKAPVYLLDPNSVLVMEANPDPDLRSRVLGDKVSFVVHPDMIDDTDFMSRIRLNGPEIIEGEPLTVTPTSSTRTLMTLGLDHNFMVKTDMEKLHFKFVRRMKGESVVHALIMSNEMERASVTDAMPNIAYLPESIGLIYGDRTTGSGNVFRQVDPRPLSPDRRTLVPYFSLYADDLRNPEDQPLCVQLTAQNARKGEEADYFIDSIVGKLVIGWCVMVNNLGILPELHGQNTLLEIDENLQPQRIVYRDFQGTYVDPEVRQAKHLPIPFERYMVGQGNGPDQRAQYSHVYDGMIGKLLLPRLVKAFTRFYPAHSEANIVGEIKRIFHNNFPDYREVFPVGTYGVKTQNGENSRLVELPDEPVFR